MRSVTNIKYENNEDDRVENNLQAWFVWTEGEGGEGEGVRQVHLK